MFKCNKLIQTLGKRSINLFLSFLLIISIIFIAFLTKVNATENIKISNRSQITIANNFAEKFCNAKINHFFDGLDNEKTLKYSYFKYIGLQNKDITSEDFYKIYITKIKEKCFLLDEDERELYEIFFKEKNLEKQK